jgi:hypothetical protein
MGGYLEYLCFGSGWRSIEIWEGGGRDNKIEYRWWDSPIDRISWERFRAVSSKFAESAEYIFLCADSGRDL